MNSQKKQNTYAERIRGPMERVADKLAGRTKPAGTTDTMDKPKLAVDFDSVLSDTSSVAFDLICGPDHDYTVDDVESWTWGFDEFGKTKYLSGLWNAWTLRPLEVPMMENAIPRKMAELQEEYEVHVVTAHPDIPGISKGKREWLDHHNVPHEEFRVVEPETSKASLWYDAYIDDKPALPQEVDDDQTVYLRDHAWNQDVIGDYIRVESITEALAKEAVVQ